MKMEPTAFLASFFFGFSILLQGCDWGDSPAAPPPLLPGSEVSPPEVRHRKVHRIEKEFGRMRTSAKCNGGHFSCNGGWKQWCSRMEKQCLGSHKCHPLCKWTCDSPKCNQECGPVCNQPVCTTRCKGFNTDSCQMQCGKPSCRVVCPKHFCPAQDCAACKTECGEPTCKMVCGNDKQPCRNVCAQPVCKWECKNPSACPKPKCAMKCKQSNCDPKGRSMFSNVPPLEPGEMEVVIASGPAPSPAAASFLSTGSSTMRVNITRMGEDHSLHQGQVDLAVVQEDDMDEATEWSKEVIQHHGHVTEHAAYCINGKFRCQGDAAWCAEQEKSVCTGDTHSEAMFAHRRPAAQSPLQP